MQNGLTFGHEYSYKAMFLSLISWGILLLYSAYWQQNYAIIVSFAITTIFIPLFYLKYILEVYTERDILCQELSESEYQANYDMLTDIPNRTFYKKKINDAIRQKKFFALFFIDLNKFKDINDRYGHHIGDEVLKEVARRIEVVLDDNVDFVARLGGDEFAIITYRKKAFLNRFLEDLEETVLGTFSIDNITIEIELSIGISLYPDDDTSASKLSKYADEAMYIAKKRLNTSHIFYDEL